MEEATLLQSVSGTGRPGGVVPGSLVLAFDVQQFSNVHLQAGALVFESTYIAEVGEAMFPGDAVGLLWPANDLDSPSVGVDLCSINPLQLSCQEDKDCPEVQQGHPGIHERENTSRGGGGGGGAGYPFVCHFLPGRAGLLYLTAEK